MCSFVLYFLFTMNKFASLIFSAAMLAVVPSMYGQFITTCFEIESILVDACGNPEGENEMVRFRTGPNTLNTANLTVGWPNGNWLGICQNGTTANVVSQLNATIQNCGYIREPNNGVLPSTSTVILVTSTNMNPANNSFAGLGDTIYMIFQCAGNTAGHFANATSTGTRTLTMSFNPPNNCSDQVTYDCGLLTDIFGQTGTTNNTPADRDGATVLFAPNGNATYVNVGCTAPFPPLAVSIGPDLVVCSGDTILLQSQISGTFPAVQWSGGTGSFLAPLSFNTPYILSPADTGTFAIVFSAYRCNDTVTDTLLVHVLPTDNFALSPTGIVTICPGETITCSAPGGAIVNWSTGVTANSITITQPGTYFATITNTCGTFSDTLVVVPGQAPAITITTQDPVICVGSSTVLTANGCSNYTWSTGETGNQITVNAGGVYYATCNSGCGSDSAAITITENNPVAQFIPNPPQGFVPLTVTFDNQSTPGVTYQWVLGNGDSSNLASPQVVYDSVGTYIVTLTVTDPLGCTATYTDTIVVDSILPYQVELPNVFTPNNDGVNDLFTYKGQGVADYSLRIYNRWGAVVRQIVHPAPGWDGKSTDGNDATEGVYYFVYNFTDQAGQPHEEKGFLHLFK